MIGLDRTGQNPDRGYPRNSGSARRQRGRPDDSRQWEVLGPLGPHGAIREVEFRNGEFKLVPIQ